MLSEYFPFPLFVMLLGAGAEFVGRRTRVARHAVESLVRAACLLLVGWALTFAGAQVFVVLGAMALAAALGWLLAVLPSWVLTLAAVMGVAVTAWWNETVTEWRLDLLVAGRTDLLEWVNLVLSPAYPAPYVLALAALGVVTARVLHPRPGRGAAPSPKVLACIATTTGLVGVGILAAHRVGVIEAGADSFGWATTVASVALAVAAWSLAEWGARVAPRITAPLAAAGCMSFTLYSLHVVWLGYWARELFPGRPDDAWVNVVGMSVLALLLGVTWQALRLPGRWWRGPLEGAVGSLAGAAGRLTPARGR